ncbi:MAG TPA: HAD family hydrolase [Burkholderiaceae bacterium]|nr:HAD family hydrolase [Burkholderiaceae bacterium]HMY99250.1 HAD family hydrolase [Burkholderiaceae bacterium]HNB46762.1 HAD family hydrolase [Burkholderiaceae bacterium]HNG79531.1 HAD family hydrolase [Burkholderiaceae bacterium]
MTASDASPPFPAARRLCLFDLDGTLIPIDSDHAFGEFMVEIGWADGQVFRDRNDAFYADYQAGTLDLAAYVDFATAVWRGKPLWEAEAERERFMCEVMQPQLHASAQALVREHRARGDLVAIVTATNEFVTAPIAAAFGVEHLLAVQLEREADGAWSGRIRGTPTFREGKVGRVSDWLAGLGLALGDFSDVVVYSDSINDLPLLELATEPVATNPSPPLEAIARERGWRVLRLFD